MRRSTLLLCVYFLIMQLATPHMFASTLPSELASLRDGSLKKLVVHDTPRQQEYLGLVDQDGNSVSLESIDSSVLVVNFFAVWCTPCRIEMPSLDNLQAGFDHDELKVVVVAVGRHAEGSVEQFLQETGIRHLTVLLDPSGDFSRQLGVFGIPTTILLDRDRQELARLIGEADWDSDSARLIVTHVIAN